MLWLPLTCSRPGSTGPGCTGRCHVTLCRACYYSRPVQACPDCSYKCGEDPRGACFREWSRCVRGGIEVSQLHSKSVYRRIVFRASFIQHGLRMWCIYPIPTQCPPHPTQCPPHPPIPPHVLPIPTQSPPQSGRARANRFKCVDPCECPKAE